MRTLNDFFDNIYCINLKTRIDRWEDVSKEFAKHILIVERVDAVNGKDFFKPGLNRNAGAYGIVLSNIKIFEDAINKGYKKILIFEDDAYFTTNINEKFWDKIEFLPNDWNMLYLGGNHQFTWGQFEMITGDKTIKITKENYNTFNYELVKTRWTQCAHAIGYNCNIFADFLARLKNLREPIDVLQPKLQLNGIYNAYAFLPSFVKQKAGFSDITNGYADYNSSNMNHF